jgi:hypothetical protein
MSQDYRRVNYIPMSTDRKSLDFIKANYNNIKFALSTSKVFVVTDPFEANLPGIAYELYQDVGLWWILAMYNGIIDPINDIVTGLQLNVPSLTDINAFLDTNPNNSSIPTVVL